MRATWLVAAALGAGVALSGMAQAGGDGEADAVDDTRKGVHEVKADDEIVVYGDMFARWDGTRWFIATEVQLPGLMWLAADERHEMRVSAFQLRGILACEKDWKLSGRRFEVDCTIEDFGLQAVVYEKSYDHVQEVLDEIDRKLSGAQVQLQVKDNGRVVNLDLEGMPVPRNQRERRIQELIRVLVSRMVVGFDMKLRKTNYLSTGQWVESRTALLSLPAFRVESPAERLDDPGNSSAHLQVGTATPASGTVVHQLNGYRGHVIVQTRGEGQVQDERGVNYKVDLTGVSVYDDDGGYMTERVWSLVAKRTAESYETWGTALVDYSHAGVLRLLGDEEMADVGPTRRVWIEGQGGYAAGAPLWEPVRP